MIVKVFDNGWGPEYPVKRFENQVIDEYLAPLAASQQKWVVINGTWYSQDYHHQVLEHLRSMDFDGIVLVSMIDPAIPQPIWYSEFQRPVLCVGNYHGQNELVFWALACHEYFDIDQDVYNHDKIDLPFMCLNRKPHWHRKQLYQRLQSHGLLARGLVSMGTDSGQALRCLEGDVDRSDHTPNAGKEIYGINNDVFTLGDADNWRRCFFNVVTETIWDIQQQSFVSEKTFKPILGMRPFVIYSPQCGSPWLESHGFSPYTNDFRDISDLDLCDHRNIVPWLKVLSDSGPEYWKKKIIDLGPKIQYNKQQFLNLVAQTKQKIKQGIICPI